MATVSRITQFLAAVRGGLVRDIPPEYQACESCREPNCNSERAEHCLDRLCGEQQERSRRFNDVPEGSGELPAQSERPKIDVPASRLTPPPSTVRSRGGEYSQAGGEETIAFPKRRQSRF